MIELIVNAWPLLLAIAAAIGGLTGYFKKVLEIRELNAKFRELQDRQRDRDRRVHIATPEEIERFAPPSDLTIRQLILHVPPRVVWLAAVAILVPALLAYYLGTLSRSTSLEKQVPELESEVVSLRLKSAEYLKIIEALQRQNEKLKRHMEPQSKELP